MCGIIMCLGSKRGANRGNNLESRVHVDGIFLEMMWYGVGRVDLVLVNEVTNALLMVGV